MAIVKFGTSVVGIRKTLGGITFSNSPSGPIAKSWTPSSMPYTPKQTSQQAQIASLVAPWNALSPTAQTDWSTFGLTPPETDTNSLGHQYFLSGFQWFIRVNVRNSLAGEARLDAPPIGGVVTPPSGVTIAAAAGPPATVEITFDAAPFLAAPYAVVYVKFARRTGIRKPHSAFYQAALTDVSGSTSLDISAPILLLFGNIQTGDSLWLRLRCQTTEGLRSIFLETSCAIT
jgi:hypothetical protein